jgi:hypothetical protein
MEFKVEGPAAIPLICLFCACAAVPFVYIIYMGIYAFNNPDSEAWLGSKGGAYSLYTNEAEATND